jgi:PAS domain S-box-containing protein
MEKNKAIFPDTGNSWLSNQKLVLTILTIGGIVVVSFWQLLDRFYFETAVPVLFWLRLGTIGFFVCNLLIAHLPKQKENTKLHIIIGFYAGTLFCTLMVALTGASQSPYWYSLFFIIIAWFVLIPYHFREMTLHSIFFIAIFVFGQIIQSIFPVVLYEILRMVFLYSVTLLVGIFASYIRNRLDSENEIIRKRLKENNDELLAVNEELHAEIENHQHTTNQLIEKQNFLDNILNNAPIVIWSIDLDGKFIYSQYTGDKALPSSERIGKSALELHKGTAVEDFLNRLLKGETQSEVLPVGNNFYDTRVTPVLNADSQKIGYMGVSMDITERVKIERELGKFKLVLDQAPGAVFIVDKKSDFEYINPEFTKISGYTEEDLLGKNLNQTLYKGSVPESRKEIIETIAAGNKWQGELLTVNKNGNQYWANTIAAPYKTEQGEIEGFIVIQQDISRRKEMEIALQEKEKLYRTLIEKSMDGVAISQDGKILLANQAFCDILGYQMDELLSTEPEKLLAAEDKEMVLEKHYKRLSGEGSPSRYSAKFLHKSGKKVILDLNAATVLMNGKNASFVTIRDITDQQRYEQALKESEEKYRTLVETSQDGICLTQDGKFKFVNRAMCEMLGYTAQELYSLPGGLVIPENMREKVLAMNHDRMEGKKVKNNYNMELIAKDGSIVEVEIQASTSEFEGRPAGFYTVHNITHSRKIQAALRESEKKYRELTEMLPQTVYELDIEGKILYMNQTGFIQFAMDNSDIGTSAYRFIDPLQHEQMRQNIIKTVTEKQFSYGNRYTAVRKDGSKFPALTYAAPMVSDDTVIGVRGIIIDISDYEAMEKALRDSEEKYRTLLKKQPTG